MKTTSNEKYFFYIILATVAVLAIAIIYPFLSAIVLAFAFAVVLNPAYRWIRRHLVKIPWIASVLTIILFLVVLCVPLFFVGNVIFHQIQNAYTYLSQGDNPSAIIKAIDTNINNLLPEGFSVNIYEKITNILSFASDNMAKFFTSTFKTGLMFVITVLTMFYMFKDGSAWKKNLMEVSPLSENNFKEIFNNIHSSINSIFRGSFFVAVIQGILVGIGLYIFGISNALLWGVIAAILSFLPGVGVAMIYIPAMLFLYFTDMHLQAFGLLAWFVTFVIIVDNILSPYFISGKSPIPSLFILMSILGGISLMGPVGVIIGPIMLSLLYSLISIYKREFI